MAGRAGHPTRPAGADGPHGCARATAPRWPPERSTRIARHPPPPPARGAASRAPRLDRPPPPMRPPAQTADAPAGHHLQIRQEQRRRRPVEVRGARRRRRVRRLRRLGDHGNCRLISEPPSMDQMMRLFHGPGAAPGKRATPAAGPQSPAAGRRLVHGVPYQRMERQSSGESRPLAPGCAREGRRVPAEPPHHPVRRPAQRDHVRGIADHGRCVDQQSGRWRKLGELAHQRCGDGRWHLTQHGGIRFRSARRYAGEPIAAATATSASGSAVPSSCTPR